MTESSFLGELSLYISQTFPLAVMRANKTLISISYFHKVLVSSHISLFLEIQLRYKKKNAEHDFIIIQKCVCVCIVISVAVCVVCVVSMERDHLGKW